MATSVVEDVFCETVFDVGDQVFFGELTLTRVRDAVEGRAAPGLFRISLPEGVVAPADFTVYLLPDERAWDYLDDDFMYSVVIPKGESSADIEVRPVCSPDTNDVEIALCIHPACCIRDNGFVSMTVYDSGSNLICSQLCHGTDEPAAYESLAAALTDAVYGDRIVVIGDAYEEVVVLKPGVRIECGRKGTLPASFAAYEPPSGYRTVKEGGVLVGIELDPAQVTPVLSAGAGTPPLSVSGSKFIVRVANARAGLRYGLKLSANLADVATAPVVGWTEAEADGILEIEVPASSSGFCRIIVTDAPGSEI